MSDSFPTWRRRLLARLAQSRFLTISVMLHLALVAALGTVVLFKVAQPVTAFETGDVNFLENTEVAAEAPEDLPPQEFDEPAAPPEIQPIAQSAISTVAEVAPSWTTSASITEMTIGDTISAGPVFQPRSVTSIGGKGGALSGKSSSFTFMGVRSTAKRVAFLLDASGSMIVENKGGPEAFEALKKELITLVDGLDPTTQFNVIMYGSGADLFQPNAVAASDENVSELRKWLEPYLREKPGLLRQNYSKTKLEASQGTTRMDMAITGAMESQSDTIFILTDGTPNVSYAADEKTIREWEASRKKNEELFNDYQRRVSEYRVKYKDEYDQAVAKAKEMNEKLQGRTQENYYWEQYAPNYPKAPSGYHRPRFVLDAEGLNKMIKEMVKEYYVPQSLPVPTLNVIGYHVDESAEAFLKDMTRGIPGKYITFKDRDLKRR